MNVLRRLGSLLLRALQQVKKMRLEGEPVRTKNPLLRGMERLQVSIEAR